MKKSSTGRPKKQDISKKQKSGGWAEWDPEELEQTDGELNEAKADEEQEAEVKWEIAVEEKANEERKEEGKNKQKKKLVRIRKANKTYHHIIFVP